MIPQLFDVLLRFRNKPIALTADIQSAFLQISIDPADRDKLRFLWCTNLNTDSPKLTQFRFCRLMFGLKPSPPILGLVVNHHLDFYEATEPKIVEELRKLYIDDFANSFDDKEVTLETYKASKRIMLEGNFNLRKWQSNDKEVLQLIKQEEQKTDSNLNADEHEVTKVLGQFWDTNADELFFDFTELIEYAKSLPITKRSVLKFG